MDTTLITEDYREQMAHLHKTTDMGSNSRKSKPNLHQLPKFYVDYDIGTVLDFGCGHGSIVQATRRMGIVAEGYDPCVNMYSMKPEGQFDAVISFDVLEHVEPEFIDETLQWIGSMARKAMYLNICTRPAKAILPDGRNAHLIIEDDMWWEDKIAVNMPEFSFARQFWSCKDNKNINFILFRS